MEPTAPIAATAAARAETGTSAVRSFWVWATTAPSYPPDAGDLRSMSVLGVRLPVRASLAILIVSLLVLLDHGGRLLGFFWDGQGGTVEMLRARAVSRGVVLGCGALLAILFVLRDAAKEVFRRLLDAVDPASVELAERTASEVDGVFDVRDLRMRWIGHHLRAELAVTVAADLTVSAAHALAHDVEHRLLHAIPRLSAVVVHTEPAAGAERAHETLAHHR